MSYQSSSHLFMIEPKVFYSNKQTADSNHYQISHKENEDIDAIKDNALKEFNNLKNQIEKHGIAVTSMIGSDKCPDHIFPNWFITFDDKTFQLFSMIALNTKKKKCSLRQQVAWFLIG